MFTFVFEQDISAEKSLKYPEAYKMGQQGRYFTFKIFWTWIVNSIFHGLVCFWVPV